MKKELPKNRVSLLLLLGNPITNEDYETALTKVETQIEKKLIDVLHTVNIHSSVKTDKYSLPVHGEITIVNRGSSYLNDAYDITEFTRKVVKKLLSDDVRKVRFYVVVEISDGNFGFGFLHYTFKYYVHQ